MNKVQVTRWRPREKETVTLTPEEAQSYIAEVRENVKGVLDVYVNGTIPHMLYRACSINIPKGITLETDPDRLNFVYQNMPEKLDVT